MTWQLTSFVRRLFSHDDTAHVAQNDADKKRLEITGVEQDKLDKQRADWEGMSPNSGATSSRNLRQ